MSFNVCAYLSLSLPRLVRLKSLREILCWEESSRFNVQRSTIGEGRARPDFQTSSESAFRFTRSRVHAFTPDSARTFLELYHIHDGVASLLRNASDNHRRSWLVLDFSEGVLESLVISAFKASNKVSKSKLAKKLAHSGYITLVHLLRLPWRYQG